VARPLPGAERRERIRVTSDAVQKTARIFDSGPAD
jgi:hypothetical protein